MYWRNVTGYNNRRVVDLDTTNVTYVEVEKVYEIILHGIEARMNEWILTGTFDVMITNNEATQGYYLVEWLTEPYSVLENTIMKGVDPSHTPFSR